MSLRCSLIVVLWFLAEGAPGWAQVDPAEAQRRQAGELHNQGRFNEAIKLLEQAREAAKRAELRARICLDLGINHAILGGIALARRSFATALTLDPSLEIDSEAVKASVVALFREERERLRGELQVTSTVVGARVSIDGKSTGTCPLVLRIPIGMHLVEIWDLEGRQQLKQQVLVRPNQLLRVEGRLASPSKIVSPPLPPAASGSAPQARRRIWTWVAAGGALAAAGAGLGLWLPGRAGLKEWQEAIKDRPPPPATRQRILELEEKVPPLYVAAQVMAGVAAGLAVTATVLYFVEGRQQSRPELAAPPRVTLSLGGASALLQGTF